MDPTLQCSTTAPNTKRKPCDHPTATDKRPRPVVRQSQVYSTSTLLDGKDPPRKFQLQSLDALAPAHRVEDEVHGPILLHPILQIFLRTGPVQRLDEQNQLGFCRFHFPQATHTRLQHSLGVTHLAGKLCRRIQHLQPDLCVSNKDVLCVQLAGLLHDVGHGPGSHLWEEYVNDKLPKDLASRPEQQLRYEHIDKILKLKSGQPWRHEATSLEKVDDALKELGLSIDENHLDEPLRQVGDGYNATSLRVCEEADGGWNVLTSRDLIFVKECILGRPLDSDSFVGRPEARLEWIYQIVSNRYTGVDVDRVDYIIRDQMRTIQVAQLVDMIETAVVAWTKDKDRLVIAYPVSHVNEVERFHRTRFALFCRVANMVLDALCRLEPHVQIPCDRISGSSDLGLESLPMSRAMYHPGSFLKLTDSILEENCDVDPEVKGIVQRLRDGDFYTCVAERNCGDNRVENDVWNMSTDEIQDEMLSLYSNSAVKLVKRDFFAYKSTAHCGQKEKNPMDAMHFVSDEDYQRIASILDYSQLPAAASRSDSESIETTFMTRSLRIFCRYPTNDKLKALARLFELWYDNLDPRKGTTGATQTPVNRPVRVTQDTDDDYESDESL